MKIVRTTLFFVFMAFRINALAQDISPENMMSAIKNDDSVALEKLISGKNVNGCYGNYSLLSQSIRFNALGCFSLLIARGADVNKICNSYVPPLMHAAKYGRLEMAKILVVKGADINYKYEGDYEPANGETPLTYAEKNNHPELVEYLKNVKVLEHH